jgi:VIT1/CCC1 family predicted Fe2+/Mn2+ transporter
MGLGGYLAARGDAEHYRAELAREQRETIEVPDEERAEVAAILRDYGISEDAITPVVDDLARDRGRWVKFMMRFELGLEAPDPKRELSSAVTIGLSYVAGGVIPLWPYLVFATQKTALTASSIVTLSALALFGALKARFTGAPMLRSALQTASVGGLAAAAAFGLARLIA